MKVIKSFLGATLGAGLSLAPILAFSAVHLITDPLTNNSSGIPPTHCGFSIDGAVDTVVPVVAGGNATTIPAPNTPPAGTVVCYADISTASGGNHTAKANAQWLDPQGLFAPGISGYSNTVNFTVPLAGSAPTTIKLVK